MFQGFNNLTSQMLTESRNMDVIANNMANISTSGYKSDQFIASTFKEELMARFRGKGDARPAIIGSLPMIRTAVESVTDYEQGAYAVSDSPLDFALEGKGFFCIQTEDGGTVYTRNGSFSLDDEGYLTLPRIGRVLGENGPIQLPTDNIIADEQGNITSPDGMTNYGRITVVDFEDYTQLFKAEGNVFVTDAAPAAAQPEILWKATESSNVNPMEEMTTMMSGQKALQSAAQMLKIYDVLMGKIVSQLGPT